MICIHELDRSLAKTEILHISLYVFISTEGVTWIVHEQPIYVSKTDIDKLREAVEKVPGTIIDAVTSNDNRPIMPLNGRVVTK